MKQTGHPTVEHIGTERCLYGGWRVTYLIDDTFEQLYYHGYTRAESERLAKQDAKKLAEQIFYNVD